MNGSITANGKALAGAVKYAAHWLDTKPSNPVLGGLVFEARRDTLTISSQSDLATARAVIDVQGDAEGTFIVAGRLIDQILSTGFPDKPITLEHRDAVVSVTSGKFKATLPAMSEKDYPALALEAPTVGVVDGARFMDAVARVGVAAGRDSGSPVIMTGVHVQLNTGPDLEEGDDLTYSITLSATDRYRVAREHVEWEPEADADLGGAFVIPASVLTNTGDAFTGLDPVRIGWSAGTVSLWTPARSLVTRTLGNVTDYPPVGVLAEKSSKTSHLVEVNVRDLPVPLKRVALLAGGDYPQAVLNLAPGSLTLRAAYEGKGDADQEIEVEYDGPECSIITRIEILQGLLGTAPGDVLQLHINPNTFLPVYATSPSEPAWCHLFMPIRHLA